MSKVYFIEGLPGSGNQIFSKRMEIHIKVLGKKVFCDSDGDLHPVDHHIIPLEDNDDVFDQMKALINMNEQVIRI